MSIENMQQSDMFWTLMFAVRGAVLEARKRTGDASLGTRVQGGRFQIVKVSARGNGQDETTVEPLSAWLPADQITSALDAL